MLGNPDDRLDNETEKYYQENMHIYLFLGRELSLIQWKKEIRKSLLKIKTHGIETILHKEESLVMFQTFAGIETEKLDHVLTLFAPGRRFAEEEY